MESQIFDIEFKHGNQEYKGWVNPSDKMNADGKPISFHVVLNDVSFGYLSYSGSWKVNEPRPHDLVECVGIQIERYYSAGEDAEQEARITDASDQER